MEPGFWPRFVQLKATLPSGNALSFPCISRLGFYSRWGFHSPNCSILKLLHSSVLTFASLLYVFIGYRVFYMLEIMLVWALCFECNSHGMAQSQSPPNINGGPTEAIWEASPRALWEWGPPIPLPLVGRMVGLSKAQWTLGAGRSFDSPTHKPNPKSINRQRSYRMKSEKDSITLLSPHEGDRASSWSGNDKFIGIKGAKQWSSSQGHQRVQGSGGSQPANTAEKATKNAIQLEFITGSSWLELWQPVNKKEADGGGMIQKVKSFKPLSWVLPV